MAKMIQNLHIVGHPQSESGMQWYIASPDEVLILRTDLPPVEIAHLVRDLQTSGLKNPLVVVPRQTEVTLTTIERLAERVHQAWMTEKQRQGFADHPLNWKCGLVRIDDEPVKVDCLVSVEKHDDAMVPYDQLDEAAKEYDRATVRAVLQALMEEGTG